MEGYVYITRLKRLKSDFFLACVQGCVGSPIRSFPIRPESLQYVATCVQKKPKRVNRVCAFGF